MESKWRRCSREGAEQNRLVRDQSAIQYVTYKFSTYTEEISVIDGITPGASLKTTGRGTVPIEFKVGTSTFNIKDQQHKTCTWGTQQFNQCGASQRSWALGHIYIICHQIQVKVRPCVWNRSESWVHVLDEVQGDSRWRSKGFCGSSRGTP